MIPKFPLLLLLLPAASALNNVFIPLPYEECNTCVDAAANSCPGDYRTKAYADCLCAGDGGPRIVNCISTCNAVDTLPMGAADKVAGGWYSYCIMFFPDLCAEAEYYVLPDWWAQKCGPGAKKGVGFEGDSALEDGDPSGSSGSGGGSGSGGSGSTSGGSGGSGGSDASPTGGAGFGGLGTGSGSKTTGSPSQATSAAGSNIHPVGWGVMVGLGMLGLNM